MYCILNRFKSMLLGRKKNEREIDPCFEPIVPAPFLIPDLGVALDEQIMEDEKERMLNNNSDQEITCTQELGSSEIISPPKSEEENKLKRDLEVTAEPDLEPLVNPLLYNNEYIRLVESCVETIKEFDGYEDRVESEETKDIIGLMKERLRENLLVSGVSFIDEENEFHILRHDPVPMAIIAEGTPVVEIISPGLAIGNRVFMKAKVKVDLHK